MYLYSEHLHEKLEFLKVWYSVFCTVMDAHSDNEYSDSEAILKLRQLRNSLVTRLPEVEAELLKKQEP